MTKLLILAIVIIVSGLLIRAIAKLPSRYDRKPKVQNSWSALDSGIDPTENKAP
ncbi:unannotated protein [freshwater metagenome]|jgi:hypothetical protein|uniref:Unannotated protein n=1 Tax=freshwater metagenome TaxID=449393 RepID=A0A6J7FK80_9ZZZZ|nr:hypothetical protein [Actinomycetota bacterium]